MLELAGQIKMEEMRFSRFLKMDLDLGRSFYQEGTFNVKVSESDFVLLWDGTIMHRSLAERKLLEGT